MKKNRVWLATCFIGAHLLIGLAASVDAQQAPPTVTIAANPDSITVGGKSTLTWSSTNATSCAASGGWTGSRATSGRRSVTPPASTTYTLACTGPGGTAAASATVTVSPAPAPTVAIAANPPSIAAGAASTLTWSSSHATACTGSGGWTGAKALNGTRSVAPAATTTYTLTCTGPGGTAAASAVVTVSTVPLPTVTITATPGTIDAGASSTLNWTSTNASSCTASGASGWSGAEALSGSLVVTPAATATYVLTCAGAGGQATAMATVTVIPAPTVTLTASPATINLGGSSTLTWSTTNATACTATWTTNPPTSGSQLVAPTVTTTYTLSCSGSGGTTAASAIVTVQPATTPTVTLTASPTSVVAGGTSTLAWSSTNASSCTASGAWSGTLATSGTQSVQVTATATYSIACSTATASVTVTVVPAGAGGSFVQGEGWASANGGPVGPFKNAVNAADYLYLIAIQEGQVTSAKVSDGAQTWTPVLFHYDSVNDETMYLMIPSNATQPGLHTATLTGSGQRVNTFKAWIIEDSAPLVVGSAIARTQLAPGKGNTINPGAAVGGAGNDVYYFVVDTTNGSVAGAEPVLSAGWSTPALYNEVLPDFDVNVGALNLGRSAGAGGTIPTMQPGSTGAGTDAYTGLGWAVGTAH